MLVERVFVLVAAVSVVILLGSWGWQASAQAAQDEQRSKDGGSGDVTLRIAGDKGTPFSGTCSVGKEEHDISGQVPQRFEYDLNSQKLECEIRKQGEGSTELNVVLENENTRSVQQSVGGEDAIIRLAYRDSKISSLVSQSSSQAASTAKKDSSFSSAQNDAGRGRDGLASPADRIQEKVNEILERALP